MSIQSSVNQALGTAAIAAKLSPTLQELGEEVRVKTESNKVDNQLKKLASKGYVDYDPKTNERYTVLDDTKKAFKYSALINKKGMLDEKKIGLGLTPSGWVDFPPREVLALDEAEELESIGELQREKVEKLKEVKKKMRSSQFGGENYGNNKQ